ncbi:MAG: SMI1/KNR4 family protein [Phycisphaerales bacterium]
MPTPTLQPLLKRFQQNPVATPVVISELQRQLAGRIPADYIRFLRLANGGEGFVGENSYLMLWPAEEIATFNAGYETDNFAPGLLLFGSDGGGNAYAFDSREAELPIVEVPFVGMSLEHTRLVASSFESFLRVLHAE